MRLTEILSLGRVRVPLQATTKTDVISELIDLIEATGGLTERDAALNAVLKREGERSTGIGYGLAIPHGKSTGCKTLAMAVGKPAVPIDFQSIDKRPVTFVVLLVSPPDQTSQHIQALAQVSRLMNLEPFRIKVNRASSAEELFEAMREHESEG